MWARLAGLITVVPGLENVGAMAENLCYGCVV